MQNEMPPPDRPQEDIAPDNDTAQLPRGNRTAAMQRLMDAELEAVLRFGAREMSLREIIELDPGAVVELDQQIHDSVDLLVSGRVFARGEVVVVDGKYGLRVTEIVSSQHRREFLRS